MSFLKIYKSCLMFKNSKKLFLLIFLTSKRSYIFLGVIFDVRLKTTKTIFFFKKEQNCSVIFNIYSIHYVKDRN
jgi:hypothetical protein